jgi:ABC-type multidrug transport system fused ATPase/permease subunit
MKDFYIDINNISKGVITGFLIAYLIILGLRPSAAYPDDILELIDSPWIFIVIFIINLYVIQWDLTIGILLALSLIALILDIIIFTEGEFFTDNSILNNKKEDLNDKKEKLDDKKEDLNNKKEDLNDKKEKLDDKKDSLFNKDYADANKIIINKLKEYKDKNDNSEAIKAYNSFI